MNCWLGMLGQVSRNVLRQRSEPVNWKLVLFAVLPIVIFLFLVMFRRNLGLRGRKFRIVLGAGLLIMVIVIPVAVLMYMISK